MHNVWHRYRCRCREFNVILYFSELLSAKGIQIVSWSRTKRIFNKIISHLSFIFYIKIFYSFFPVYIFNINHFFFVFILFRISILKIYLTWFKVQFLMIFRRCFFIFRMSHQNNIFFKCQVCSYEETRAYMQSMEHMLNCRKSPYTFDFWHFVKYLVQHFTYSS